MKKLLFVLLLSISSVVHAQWTLIQTSDTAAFFVDNSTIQQVHQYKRVWSKTEYFPNSKMAIENKINSTRMYYEFDCREKKSRFLYFYAYNQSNLVDLSYNDNKTDEWNFIAPNTVHSVMLEVVCKSK
jgi:hypothetical protein